MSEHKVYALEGIDGSGKTISGQLVAEKTGGKYLYCMDGNPLKRWRKNFDTMPNELRFAYYLAVPLINYRRIEKMRTSTDVFLDRSLASTIAYHRAYGLSEKWFKLIPSWLYEQVDTMLYFFVDETERINRINNRAVLPDTMTVSDRKSFEYSSRIDEAYRKVYTDRTILVDTGNKTPDEVAEFVITKIKS